MKLLAVIVVAIFVANLTHADAPAPTNAPPAVQVDVSKILNARGVATLTDGKVVPLQIDGGCVITKAAAVALGSKYAHGVPDDGKFPANADHPEVVLHYSNGDGTANQVRISLKEDEYSFDVPPKNYAKMFLFFTSFAHGPAPLQIVLTYQDGTAENRDIIVPDWYKNLDAGDKDCVYLAFDMDKWGKDNKMMEPRHHHIFGLDVHPATGKVLTQIKVHKPLHPIVIFWGATGQPAN